MAAKANIVIDQGTTYETTITLADDTGVIYDLTGYTGAAQIRKHYTSSNSVAFTVSVAASNGEITLALTANATANLTAGRYVFDVEVTQANTSEVFRILEGIATVTPNVTR